MPDFNRSIVARIASLLVFAGALAGCSDIYFDRRDTVSLASGEAQSANKVAQMVDPWPAHSANRNIAFNGQKMQSAVERYRTNRVIQPVNATTSSVAYQQAQQAAATANATQINPSPAIPPMQAPAAFGSTTPNTAAASASNANNNSSSNSGASQSGWSQPSNR